MGAFQLSRAGANTSQAHQLEELEWCVEHHM